MAYDFAKRKKKRKRTSKKQQELSSRPVWFGTGVACGLFIAYLLHLTQWLPHSAPDNAVAKQTAPVAIEPKQAPKKAEQAAGSGNKTARFEFYDMLPERQAKVSQSSKGAYKTREELKQKPISYLLQAGSFAVAKDAENHRATITLLGLTPRVEAQTLPSGTTAHRVFVGPYASHGAMEHARATLHSEGIETLLLEKR
ncbi:MAG: SPOR domain-containing protein [Pseudomonadales bacterium]